MTTLLALLLVGAITGIRQLLHGVRPGCDLCGQIQPTPGLCDRCTAANPTEQATR